MVTLFWMSQKLAVVCLIDENASSSISELFLIFHLHKSKISILNKSLFPFGPYDNALETISMDTYQTHKEKENLALPTIPKISKTREVNSEKITPDKGSF